MTGDRSPARGARLDTVDRAVVNAFQGGFPVTGRPFQPAAVALSEHGIDVTAGELVRRVRRLDDRGVLSRFGPLINADAIGGRTTLAAMCVPEDRFEEVADRVNAHPEVAHNYARDHELSMWFVVSVGDPDRIGAVLADVEAETGLEVYDLPKRREFHLGARFPVPGPLYDGLDRRGSEDGAGATGSRADAGTGELGPAERDLLIAVQDGLPATATPYEDVAARIGRPADWTVETVRGWLADGAIRRIGVVPNHYALGYTENAMTVWDVPDDAVGAVGRAVGSLPFVTHCYERPRHDGIWPYNVFAMVHGRTPAEAATREARVREAVVDECGPVPHEALYSTRVLKKTGIRLAARADSTARSVG